jgi:hypothetical protein
VRLQEFIRSARVSTYLVRSAEFKAEDFVPNKHKKEVPKPGDPHPKGGVYVYRVSLQAVREALPSLLNEGVRIGRVMKVGAPNPGQKWVVEVSKPGTNSMTQNDKGEWILNPYGGVPGALVVYTEKDQLVWTGEAYDCWDHALLAYSQG